MKTLSLTLLLFIVSFVSAQIPEKAEDISPILIGETIPEATLLNSDGTEVDLKNIIKEKPTVLVFYRGGWCPYCNNQLSGLAEIEKNILELGYQIVAISPDNFKTLKNADEKLNFSLLSDVNADFIQAIGIGFETPDGAKDYIFRKTNTEATEVLPVPTVLVLDKSGKVLFEYINPDYSTRITPKLLLAVLKSI